MSLDRYALSFLIRARRHGTSFAQTATLGRQGLAASTADIRHSLSVSGADAAAAVPDSSSTRWLEPMLKCLGAKQVVSVDASDYEGATYLHDMNLPLPSALEGKFTVVIDVGTLEHVFDFPTAVRNLMRMVEIGGHLLLVTPANNEAGHGFYQFSPEVFFRVLSTQFGFTVEEMLIREVRAFRGHWYRVFDPELVGQRAQFRSRRATYLYIRALRVGRVPNLSPPPQQSDYSTAWKTGEFGRVAQPGIDELVRRLGHHALARAIENAPLGYLIDGPVAWMRRLRMFRRVRYTRLPSHFVRLRGPDAP